METHLVEVRKTVGNRVRRFFATSALALGVCGILSSATAEVPPRKVALIQQALASMKLDAKIQGMINTRVEARVQKIRIDNPGLSDSLSQEIRSTIAQVYQENRDGRDGLDAQVYAVFDRHLTEEDLKFISKFNAAGP